MRDEKTGDDLAKIAGRILNLDDREILAYAFHHPGNLRRLAASALTQAPDHEAKVA